MIEISADVAQRFILGKQGLWPGRRWRGLQGTEQAMRAMEYLQLDLLQIIARSHDIKLHSRVLDYAPSLWEEVTYGQRKFFDWGGWLAARPMEELPHWRVVMRRERDAGTRLGAMARVSAQVRLLRAAHPVGGSARRAFRQQARPDDQHVRDVPRCEPAGRRGHPRAAAARVRPLLAGLRATGS